MSDNSSHTATPASQQAQSLDAQHSPSTSSQQQQQQPPSSPPAHSPQPRRFTSEDREFLDNISSTLRSLSEDLRRWRRRVDERDTPHGRDRQERRERRQAREAEWEARATRQFENSPEGRRMQAMLVEQRVRLAQSQARHAAERATWTPERRQRADARRAADDAEVRAALEAAGLGSEVRRGGVSGGAGSTADDEGRRQAGA